jgi:glycogen operon protein
MTEEEWNAGWVRCLGLHLNGRTLNDVDRYGELVRDDSFLFCLNPHHEQIQFYMPASATGFSWEVIMDTSDPSLSDSRTLKTGESYEMLQHSAVLFRELQLKSEAEEERNAQVRKEHTVDLKHERKAEELVQK